LSDAEGLESAAWAIKEVMGRPVFRWRFRGCMMGGPPRRCADAIDWADLGIPILATNQVHYHDPRRRMLQECGDLHPAWLRDSSGGVSDFFEWGEIFEVAGGNARAVCGFAGGRCGDRLRLPSDVRFRWMSCGMNIRDEIVPAGKTPVEYLAELARAERRTASPTVGLCRGEVRRTIRKLGSRE